MESNEITARKFSAGVIAPLGFVSFVCLACLVSILYVSQTNGVSQQKNHWQELARIENQYQDIKRLVASNQLVAQGEQVKDRARTLALIYRQEAKQEDAAAIYRMLWLSHSTGSIFISDARELASLYVDMGAFKSAVETYQKILDYDKARLPAADPAICCDINNLGQCYYTAASCTAEPSARKNYLISAGENFGQAEKIIAAAPGDEKNKSRQSIIKLNQVLLEMDLPAKAYRK